MAIASLTITNTNLEDGKSWTNAKIEAWQSSVETWAADQVVAKAPDKTATETIAGAWTFTLGPTFTAAPTYTSNTMLRSDGDVWTIPDAGAQTFVGTTATQTLTGKTIGGVLDTNLVDKSAAETISGAWSFTGAVTF